MTAWYRWSYFIITPVVFWLIYTTETCFILKDYSYSFIRVNVSNFFYFGVDFFEAWIASLFAFLRCLLSGILFLNSCLFNTYYIWPLPTGCPTNSIYAFSISLAVIACPFSAVSSNCFKNSFSCSKDKFLLFPGLFLFFSPSMELFFYLFNHANNVVFLMSNFSICFSVLLCIILLFIIVFYHTLRWNDF